MPTRKAQFVTIIYSADESETYENVTVDDHRASRLGEDEKRFKSIMVTPEKLLKQAVKPPTRPSPTRGVKNG